MGEEEILIPRAMAGDREAFTQLVVLHQARLRALAALLVPGRDDVHDIVQEAFIDAWRWLPGFDPSRAFGPWLRTICRNRSYKFLRDRLPQRRRELALVDAALLADPGPPDETASEERLNALRTCLGSLDEAQRQVLSWRYQDDQPVQDIADRLGKHPNSISMILLRLKAALMKCVDGRLRVAP